MRILEIMRETLWSGIFVPLFLMTGAVCVFALAGGKREKGDKKKRDGISPVRTLFLNLASTIGTGNIVGVSLAIAAGGAGSVFWMWAAAALGMCISYTENSLGVKYREKNDYPVPYMPKAFAYAFSVCCILGSLGMGNMTQSNSAAEAARSAFGAPAWATGAVMSVLAALIILRGLSGILKFTDRFVPLMAIFYTVSALAVIIICRKSLPDVLRDIFREALSLRAVLGGTAATGIARGVFSGEAGLGSSVIVSSRSNAKSPETQGFVGMMSIFIDTFVMCTLTALAILTANSVSAAGAFYKTLGAFGGKLLNVSLIFFAFTTIIGWSYYGEVCGKFLFGERAEKPYKIIFAAFVFVGAVTRLETVWALSDIFNALMAVPNLAAIVLALRRARKKPNASS